MGGDDGEGDDVAGGRHDGDAALAPEHVDAGVGEGGDRVAGEGGQEDERHRGVGEVIVAFELEGVALAWPGRVATFTKTHVWQKGLSRWSAWSLGIESEAGKPTPMAASFIPAMMKDKKAKASLGMLPRG